MRIIRNRAVGSEPLEMKEVIEAAPEVPTAQTEIQEPTPAIPPADEAVKFEPKESSEDVQPPPERYQSAGFLVLHTGGSLEIATLTPENGEGALRLQRPLLLKYQREGAPSGLWVMVVPFSEPTPEKMEPEAEPEEQRLVQPEEEKPDVRDADSQVRDESGQPAGPTPSE
jgi:hypothetical protein